MKLAIFGATGQTGIPLVRNALDLGYEIFALARNPNKMNIQHKNLTIVKGDIINIVDVEKVICNSDIVISALNVVKNASTKQLSEGMKNIIDAMGKYKVMRIIATAAAPSCKDENDEINKKYDRIIKMIGIIVKYIYPLQFEDLVLSTRIIQQSDRDWTIVRMPIPTNSKKSKPLNIGYVNRKTKLKIGRIDAAKALLSEVQNIKYYNHSIVATNL
jgi:putative NADH-flavin reductase